MEKNFTKNTNSLLFVPKDIVRATCVGVMILVQGFQPLTAQADENTDKLSVELENQQKQNVTGVVTDEKGQPLSGVLVAIKGTTTGDVTKIDGDYSVDVAPGQTLVFSFIGYKTQEIVVGSEAVVNVGLEVEGIEGDEVVVVGYGTVKKSDLTGSVGSVKMEDVSTVGATSVDRALQGQIAGVSVSNKTGQPGESMNIVVRGRNSITGSNDPLYVVDGMPVEGIQGTVTPEDIVSMEILKDASATAIYGSRGANGVVLITTRRGGKNKKTVVSYNGYTSWQSLRNKLDLLNRDEYVDMVNTVSQNDGNGIVYTDAEAAALPDTDWQDEVYKTAFQHSHQLSISGGSDKSSIYASVGYLNQEGIINKSGYESYSVRLNADQEISDKFKLSTNLSYINSVRNNALSNANGTGAITYHTILMQPTVDVYDENGDYTVFKGTAWGGTNPIGVADNVLNRTTNSRFVGNMALDYKIIDGLTLKVSAGAEALSSTGDGYTPIGIKTGGSNLGKASKSKSNMYSIINENILNYTKDFDNGHSLTAMGGITFQTYQYDNLGGSSNEFVSDVYGNNNLGAGANPGNPSSGRSESSMVSFLGRVNYNIKDRYLFTVTGRYDGSSKFGANNKFAFFPSGAFAWRISEEDFMKDIDWIHSLKLKASYGLSGSQAIGSYATLAKIGTNSPTFNGERNVGFQLSSMGNDDLKWETTSQFDTGIDFSVLGGKLSFTADYYYKETNDILYNVTIPPSSGYSSMTKNVGTIQNKGFEFSVTSVNIQRAVNWTTNFNIAFNRQLVTDLGNDANGNPIELVNSPMSGGNWCPLTLNRAPYELLGYKLDGIYQNDADAIANGEPNKQAGDYKIVDTDGNGVINSEDKTLITNLQPDFTFGMTNTVAYKGFEFSFLITGTFGNDIINEFNKSYTVASGLWNMRKDAWEDCWSESNRDAKFAKAYSGSISKVYNAEPSELWVENGSYLRFKDIRLAYTLPSKLFKNTKRKPNISLYVSGQNLITITNYSHYDPEASWTSSKVIGWDRGGYPSYKSYTFGAQVSF